MSIRFGWPIPGEQMKRYLIGVACASLFISGCTSDGSASGKRGMTNMETGAVIGAVGGAAVGAAVTKKHWKGALIGAVGGGLAGGAVGAYMDSQKKDLEKSLKKERDAGAISVTKLPGDVVKVVMTNQTAFDTNSADIKPGFYTTMDKLSDIVIRYGKTALTVVGHTDSKGSEHYNLDLSQRRAQSVVDYFKSKDVNPARLTAVGKGESEPVAGNDNEVGRQANRRVEILVEPIVAQ
jgi:outer membrane protein OmpA-like peptidoglycan-associated protein